MRSTSSARYKTAITDIKINTEDIFKLRPVSYLSKADGKEYFGLIAEEVAVTIPLLASYAREKDVVKGSTSEKLIPDAVQYPMLAVLLLNEIKKQKTELDAQKKINKELLLRLEKLEQMLNKLIENKK